MTKHDHCPACGYVLSNELPRSPKQHRAFFHMVKIALKNWPEAYADYQPRGLTPRQKFEDLRAWLLCKAGHRCSIMAPLDRQQLLDAQNLAPIFEAVLLASRGAPTWPIQDEQGKVYFVQPKSINWNECSHEDFKVVFDEVLYIIEQITGIKIEFIKQELKRFEGK